MSKQAQTLERLDLMSVLEEHLNGDLEPIFQYLTQVIPTSIKAFMLEAFWS